MQPWLLDRLLRNLLADMSGNTHRAEICIDKLYSPQGPMGRLGLVELRAFEMAPNARMSLAQRLLVRALVTSLARKPLDGPLIRWGTALADRFMLPEFLWADFLAVLSDLAETGYGFNSAWFEPQRAFRFPIFGAAQFGDVTLTLRQALEPWHVLAEHHDDGGVSRPVDSSLARVEVLAEHFDPAAHAVSCNGRRLPMTEAAPGRYTAGVRYKAWKPDRGLHPTIDPHTPLRFALHDLRNDTALGAFSLRAANMFGKRPKDADAARARRRARFIVRPPVGATIAPEAERHAEFPTTLDLRRF